MPKYYRFRAYAEAPTRKSKRKEREKERELERSRLDPDRSWLDLMIECSPASSWYMRRTSWRTSWFPRQLAAGLRTSLQLNNRRIFVFKLPTAVPTI